jgi:hypothetical protein
MIHASCSSFMAFISYNDPLLYLMVRKHLFTLIILFLPWLAWHLYSLEGSSSPLSNSGMIHFANATYFFSSRFNNVADSQIGRPKEPL